MERDCESATHTLCEATPVKAINRMESYTATAALLYNDIAKSQLRDGKMFIAEISPKPGDTVLDLGCGTGGLTAHLAKVVGPNGTVTGVDPDSTRIALAQASNQQEKNLTFVEGSCEQFPDMGLEKYDLIFSSNVFHWVSNKEEALRIAYGSLKPGGRIALQFCPEDAPLIERYLDEFYPDLNTEQLFSYEPSETLQQYFLNVGFDITNIHHYTSREYFDNLFDFGKWLDGSMHGLTNVETISKERLEKFAVPSMEDGKVLYEVHMIQVVGKK